MNVAKPQRIPAVKAQFLDEESRFIGRFSRQVMHTIGASFAPFKYAAITYLIVGVFARISLLSTANIIGYWADSLCKDGPNCRPAPGMLAQFGSHDYLMLLTGVVLVGFVLNIIFRVGISRSGAKAVSMLYDEVTMHVSRQPMSFFDKTPVGRIMSRFSSDYAAIFRMAGGPLGEFLGLAFDLVATLILLSLASLYYLPLVLLAGVAYFTLYRLNTPRLRHERRKLAATRAPSIAHFAETVQGARTIKVFGRAENFTRRFDKLVDILNKQRLGLVIVSQAYSLQMVLVTAVMLLVTGLLGASLVASGQVTAGSLATAFTFILITSSTIQQFFEWLSNLEEALTGVERMDDYLRRPLEPGASLPPRARFFPEMRRATPLAPAAAEAQPRGASIRIDDLWLRYAPHLPWVLQGLSLDIEPGERLAVVGRTGSGKSTLIQALFLLYPPQKGRIVVDGVSADLSPAESCDAHSSGAEASHIDLAAFRQKIALIPQEPTLFRGTLRDNLVAFGSRHPGDEHIWSVLREIGLEGWMKNLGHGAGLDYPVDERGANLSAGERQLLCMARCFLTDAPIVVTDEATSAIDPASEELLVHALEQRTRGRTLIIVAHRLSTVASCDRVLWLDQGRVRMIGTPEEVLPIFSKAAPADETESPLA